MIIDGLCVYNDSKVVSQFLVKYGKYATIKGLSCNMVDFRYERLFIEMILSGLPIGSIVFRDDGSGNLEVIDGQKRLNALYMYKSNIFGIQGGGVFDDLPNKLKNRIDDYWVNCYVVELIDGSSVSLLKSMYGK